MRLPRVRFTVRWMIVLVMLVAVSLAGWRIWQRRVAFLDKATMYAHLEQWAHRAIAKGESSIAGMRQETAMARGEPGVTGEANENAAQQEQWIGDYVRKVDKIRDYLVSVSRQKAKYERAARVPWRSVEPDTGDEEATPVELQESGVLP